ncbi:hypothetical protein BC830DRAFT_1169077 [Chytriomyces sp. MP71]|nr:hypothetical protein BC830DRAFT_1169077 [Chytriomyces sp. MP71]
MKEASQFQGASSRANRLSEHHKTRGETKVFFNEPLMSQTGCYLPIQMSAQEFRIAQVPLLIIILASCGTKVLLSTQVPQEMSQTDISRLSRNAMADLFNRSSNSPNNSCNPNRFIYALAGLLFTADSPHPFGGPKRRPGWALFCGKSPQDLLTYIIDEAFRVHWECRGNDAIRIVAVCANEAVELHDRRNKDVTDELVLKGLKKAGHIAWNGAYLMPKVLRYFRV